MDGRCERHQFEAAIGLCEFCGEEFCGECLVHPLGPKKPPFCIPCTISQSGLRNSTNKKRRKLSRKERKEMASQLSSNDSGVPAVVSASEAALRSTGKPTVHMAEDESAGKGRRGRKGKRNEKEHAGASPEASSVPGFTPVSPVVPVSEQSSPAPEDVDDTGVPSGVGMTVPGADMIDWSKPFEINS